MKMKIALLLCLGILFMLAGCGSNSSSGRTGSPSAGVNDVLAAGIAAADSGQIADPSADNRTGDRQSGINADAPAPEPANESEAAAVSAEGIDVDLTALSSTMVYSEVYSMMAEPERYIGKTVKMDGLFAYYHDEATDNYYYACIIQDATACCAQGIEFVLTEEYSYPEDYPQVEDEICVVGVFDTYLEGGYTYCTLRNARLL
jgi:hypothetical protein